LEEKQLLKIVGPEISNPSLATGKCMSPTKYLQLFQISWGTTQANNVTKLLEVVLEALYGEIPSKKSLYGDI